MIVDHLFLETGGVWVATSINDSVIKPAIIFFTNDPVFVFDVFVKSVLVCKPVIGLIKWLRPNGLKVCSYVSKCAEFKNQTLF